MHTRHIIVNALAIAVLATLAVTAQPAASARAAGVQIEKNVQYGQDRGRNLYLDVYRPDSTGSGRPGVILIHGGGWYRGDKSLWTSEGNLLAQMGWVGFAINYDMKQPRWPGEFDDVQTSITWVREHASTYGVDPAKLGVIGSSAGAHLGDLAGDIGSGSLTTGTRVAAVVSWSAPFDLTELGQNPLGPPEDGCTDTAKPVCENRVRIGQAVTGLLACQQSACPDLYASASPSTHIDPTDPPILIANSQMELIPLQQAQQAHDEFDAKGVPNKLVVVPGNRHASQYSDQIWSDTVSWLQTYIGTGSPPPTSSSSPPPTSSSPPGSPSPTGGRSSGSFPVLPVAIAVGVVLVVALGAGLSRRSPRRGPPAQAQR
jgi:acetyl esterase